MPQAPLLDDDEIRQAISDLAGWELREGRLVKRYQRRDFLDALRFVQQVAGPAEAMNHHPDVCIHWREVTLSLWTHAAGGVTQRDVRLARAIDELPPDG
jgi:4a-hydroxytetrahydrobiopterin dehydratase